MTKFAILGEPLAVELANTIVVADGERRDLLRTDEDLRAWVEAEGDIVEPRLCPRVGEVRRLRAAVRELFAALLEQREPDDRAMSLVNATSRAAPARPVLSWPPGGTPGIEAAGGRKELLGAIARSAIEVVGGPQRERLRRCEGPTCILLFVAEHSRRRWCSPGACGNRVRVARHYRRQRAGA